MVALPPAFSGWLRKATRPLVALPGGKYFIQNPIFNFIFSQFVNNRIIEMPRPYSKSKYCVTLAPDIPPPPLDGMGITLALSECVYDSENNHQDWILNFNSTLPEAVTSGNVEFNL